jgi:hypothetical protein
VISHGPAPRPVAPVPPAPARIRPIAGQISANEGRAQDDARRALREAVAEWLDPEVPRSWTPSSGLLEAMIQGSETKEIVKDYGPMYVAELRADFSPEHRARLVEAYNSDLIRHRLAALGGALAFVLICLAALSGYIRADEATKGYYTNRLRMLTAAGVGAAGAILYNMMA